LRLADRYDLVRASSAEQACELLGRRGGEFAAILTNLELKGELDGVDLAALLRGRSTRAALPDYAWLVPRLEIPIVLVTVDDERVSDARLEEIGSVRVIRKPVDFNALNIAIAQAHLARVMARSRERT
jgi:CheY-like chemotaxis protein